MVMTFMEGVDDNTELTPILCKWQGPKSFPQPLSQRCYESSFKHIFQNNDQQFPVLKGLEGSIQCRGKKQ